MKVICLGDSISYGQNVRASEAPVIEDDVTIGCDSAILGGVTIGAGSFIGARVFVTDDIPPGSYVTAKSSYSVRPRR